VDGRRKVRQGAKKGVKRGEGRVKLQSMRSGLLRVQRSSCEESSAYTLQGEGERKASRNRASVEGSHPRGKGKRNIICEAGTITFRRSKGERHMSTAS